MSFEGEFWVAVASFLFVALLIYAGVHTKVNEALDERRNRVVAELEEARRLKEEAQSIVAEYQRKRGEAEREAEAMIANAQAEGERYAAEAKAKMDEFVARRTKMAETKIAQAEAQALADVRAAAADAAVAAARDVLTQTAKGRVGEDLVSRGIAEVRAKLH
jgi:F-type H+-transporting ATPase subunit b